MYLNGADDERSLNDRNKMVEEPGGTRAPAQTNGKHKKTCKGVIEWRGNGLCATLSECTPDIYFS